MNDARVSSVPAAPGPPEPVPSAVQARLRAHLAAARRLAHEADFSGRAVLVPDPSLGLDECGLPRALARGLFFVPLVGAQAARGRGSPSGAACEPPHERLDRVLAGRVVLISRGEMLDRTGIQAFWPRLVEGTAIRISPLAMRRMQLVPDGREVAVSLPGSERAQREARDLMGLAASLRSPVDRSLLLSLSPEALAGLYRLTRLPPAAEGLAGALDPANHHAGGPMGSQGAPPRHFATAQEVSEAFARGELSAGATVRVGRGRERRLSTAGRCVIAAELPMIPGAEREARIWTLQVVRGLLDQAAAAAGDEAAARAAQALERVGTAHAMRSGLSLGVEDLIGPRGRDEMIAETHARCAAVEEEYSEGLTTDGERYNKLVDLWSQTVDRISWDIQQQLEQTASGGSLAAMVRTGAVESGFHAARRLGGITGLMAIPSGEISERPGLGTLRSGLESHEFFLGTMAGRGAVLLSQAKATGQAAWLGRLAGLLRGLTVVMDDCQTPAGLRVRSLDGEPSSSASLRGRIAGRILAREVEAPGPAGRLLALAGGAPTAEQLDAIDQEGPRVVEVRSAVGCEARGGLCAVCAGAPVGEPVGMQAAQALVVASAKLGRRLFWPGQGALDPASRRRFEAVAAGKIVVRRGDLAPVREGVWVVVSPDAEIAIEQAEGEIVQRAELLHGCELLATPGEQVERGRRLTDPSLYCTSVVAERDGTIEMVDLIQGLSLLERVDSITGLTSRTVLDHFHGSSQAPAGLGERATGLARGPGGPVVGELLQPRLVLIAGGNQQVIIPGDGAGIMVAAGEEVKRGQPLLTRPRPWSDPVDRLDWAGLRDLLDLRFEVRVAVLSEIAGVLSFGRSWWTMRSAKVTPEVGRPRRYRLPRWDPLPHQTGERVQAGDRLAEGVIDPSSIVRVSGRLEAAGALVDRLLELLWMGGASIASGHVEVVAAALLRQVRVKAAGEGPWARGALVDREEFTRQASRIEAAGQRAPEAEAAMVGVAAAARAIRRAARPAEG